MISDRKRASSIANLQKAMEVIRAGNRKKRPKIGRALKQCSVCGTSFRPGHSLVKTCGKVCSGILRRRYGKERVPNVVCKQCGKAFHTYGHKKRIFCSYQCHLDSGGAFRAGLAAARMRVRYGAKKDANHHDVVEAFEKLGGFFLDLSGMGCGVPDGLLWIRGAWHLIEIKNPNTGYGRRGLNKAQRVWAAGWRGGGVYVIKSIDQAVAFSNGNLSGIECIGGWVDQRSD